MLKAHRAMMSKLPSVNEEYPRLTAGHLHAGLVVQTAIRGFLLRYRMQAENALKSP